MAKEVQKVDLGYLLDAGRTTELLDRLPKRSVEEQVEFFSSRPLQKVQATFQALDWAMQAQIISHLPNKKQAELLSSISLQQLAKLLSALPKEACNRLYSNLNPEQRLALQPFLTNLVQQRLPNPTIAVSGTIGSIMHSPCTVVRAGMLVREFLACIRGQKLSEREAQQPVCVVDANQKFLGFVSLAGLLSADPEKPFAQQLDKVAYYARVDTPLGAIVSKLSQHNMPFVPVLDAAKQLVGLVSQEEVKETSSGLASVQGGQVDRFMGIISPKGTVGYWKLSSWQHFQQRVIWLFALFVFTGLVYPHIATRLSGYDYYRYFSFFIPMIAGIGGNAGGQTATLIIRALSLGEIKLRNWLEVVLRELRIGLLVALSMIPGILLVVFFSGDGLLDVGDLPDLDMALLVLILAVGVQLFIAMLLGTLFPILLNHLGVDPANAASPAIMTVMDLAGIAIYLQIALGFHDLKLL